MSNKVAPNKVASGKTIRVDVAPGELIDKITILEIKQQQIQDQTKLQNVATELSILSDARDQHVDSSDTLDDLTAQLRQINQQLWNIEDEIRVCERGKDFGSRFVELARAVYQTNDQRARAKRQINELLGSAIIEEKDYEDYE